VTIGEGTGIIGIVRSWLLDRPNVRIVPKLRDYGEPSPTMFIERTGLYFDVEIHSTGPQPVFVRDVGLELGDGTTLTLGRIEDTLERPDFRTLHWRLQDLRAEIGTRGVAAVYATATPERVFRRKLAKEWRRFPHELPPSEAGRDHGLMMA
jgi:hypothetical protein